MHQHLEIYHGIMGVFFDSDYVVFEVFKIKTSNI